MDAGLINWPALVEAFRGRKIGSGEIKPTTWTNTYVRRMRLILAAVDRCQTPVQLLEAITAPWANQPGCRGRQLQCSRPLHSCAGVLILAASLQPGRPLLI